jgi:hypothetical protein
MPWTLREDYEIILAINGEFSVRYTTWRYEYYGAYREIYVFGIRIIGIRL